MFTPPPVPLDANHPVVAGPVLSAGSMWWAEASGERLLVRVQGPRGTVRTVGTIGRPASVLADVPTDEAGGRLAVRGHQIALTTATFDDSTVTCDEPCYGLFPPPAQLAERFIRGTPGHLRVVRELHSRICHIPAAFGWTRRGLVMQGCRKILLERHVLARGKLTLVGARGRWVAYGHEDDATVRSVAGHRQRYTTPIPAGSAAYSLSSGGALGVVASATERDACGSPLIPISEAEPSHPTPIALPGTFFGGPFPAPGSRLGVVTRAPSCTYQLDLVGPRGTLTPVGSRVDYPLAVAFGAHEVAVKDTTALRRFRF